MACCMLLKKKPVLPNHIGVRAFLLSAHQHSTALLRCAAELHCAAVTLCFAKKSKLACLALQAWLAVAYLSLLTLR